MLDTSLLETIFIDAHLSLCITCGIQNQGIKNWHRGTYRLNVFIPHSSYAKTLILNVRIFGSEAFWR